jgi:DNA-binding CsgD family transcriptional regulator
MEPAIPAAQLLPAAAREFLSNLDEVRPRRVVAAVTGARGSGKSAVLVGARHRLERGGVGPVASSLPWHESPRAVVVDDVHLLDRAQLAALRELVDDGVTSVIVSFPPFRRAEPLRELAAALERHGPAVALGPLKTAEIAAALAATASPAGPEGSAAVAIEESTAGSPWLVRRLLVGLRGRISPADVERSEQDAVQRLTVEVGALDPRLRDLLVALAVGFDGTGWLPPGHEDRRVFDDLIADAHDAGLLTSQGEVVPLVARAVLRSTPAHRVRSLHEALVDEMERSARLDTAAARALARSRLHDARVERVLIESADALLRSDPQAAADLYKAAVDAGSRPGPLAARRAEAALGTADFDAASRFIDEHFGSDGDLSQVADTAAALWAHRGSMERAAECYRVLGRPDDTKTASLASIAYLAIGDAAGAERSVAEASQGAAAAFFAGPTLAGSAVDLMERGLRASLDGAGHSALGLLVRSTDAMTSARTAAPLPESPAGLCAIVAISLGDLDTAASVLDSALETDRSGSSMRTRLRLLRAWVWMLADRIDVASALIAELAADGEPLARDQLLLAGLRVGVARRADDLPRLVEEWRTARSALLHAGVDLFALLPLGELAIAAARLRDRPRTSAALADAWQLLERLGLPPVWSAPLHFAEVQSAILAESPSELAHHASALRAIAETTPVAAACASASLSWAAVLSGSVDPRAVIASAKALAAVGRAWDGARLAGHAAAHVEDRKEMARLLATARELHPGAGQPLPATGPVATVRTGPTATLTGPIGIVPRESNQLSAREREVAALFLEGRSYREIGEAMFISPRTVEHHMARIRSRYDAVSRSELLAVLRRALGDGSVAGAASEGAVGA